MLIDKEIYEKIIKLEKIPRSKKIWYQNIKDVRKKGIKYAMNDEELEEYVKCSNSIYYFIENYCNVKLYDFQKEMINNFNNYRFNINMISRQCGSTNILSLFILYKMLFNKNYHINLIANKILVITEVLNIIKKYYKILPFSLKQGIISWCLNSLKFENGSEITNNQTVSKNLTIIIDFAKISNIETYYMNILPDIVSDNNKKLFILSRPNGNNLFSNLVQLADKNENIYKILRVYWWQVPNRDDKWKQEQIKIIGKDLFAQEYELAFLSK